MSDTIKVRPKFGRPEKKELFDLYWNKGLNEAQIGDIYHVEPETVMTWIIREDIALKGYYEALQLSYFRSGGIPASTQVTLEHVIPFDCITTELVLAYPSGCQGLVQVWLTDGNSSILFPLKGSYVALENVTQSFIFVTFLKTGSKLRVVIANTDSAFSHDVNAIVSIQKISVQSVK